MEIEFSFTIYCSPSIDLADFRVLERIVLLENGIIIQLDIFKINSAIYLYLFLEEYVAYD